MILLDVSTVGTLATWIASEAEWRDDVAALVTISPNFGLNDSRAWVLTLPWGAQLAQLIQGPGIRLRAGQRPTRAVLNHVLAGDTLSPGTTASVVARILSFVQRMSEGEPN